MDYSEALINARQLLHHCEGQVRDKRNFELAAKLANEALGAVGMLTVALEREVKEHQIMQDYFDLKRRQRGVYD